MQWSEPEKPKTAMDNSGNKIFEKLSIKPHSVEKVCLHCKKNLEKAQGDFCCNGCEAVYNFIHLNNFDNYYQLMKNLGKSPDTQNSQENYLNIFENSDEKINEIFKLNNNRYGFYIPEIKCAACLWLIEKVIAQCAFIKNVNVNLATRIVSFDYSCLDYAVEPRNDKTQFVPSQFIENNNLQEVALKLAQIGYTPYPPPFASLKEFRTKEEKERLKDIAITGFAAGNIMLLALSNYFGHYFGIEQTISRAFSYISMFVAIPATLYGGRSFFKNSFHALRYKKIHMDIPISFALLISLFVSAYKTFMNSQVIYYDTLTGLVFLLLVGRYVNDKYLSRAKELGENSKELIPKESFLIKENDILEIPIGKTFPVDGVIISGITEVNEAALTGEESPVLKNENDSVFAGSQNLLKPVRIKALKTGHDTWVASLNKLVENAREQKTIIETRLQKILPYFVFFILFSAFLSIPVWYFINPQKILDVFVSILVVSCPCALALATPLAISQALKTLWSRGIIVKSSTALETLANINTVVFDKTGTLTNSNLKITSTKILCGQPSEIKLDEILNLFAFVCRSSLHHISKAIYNEYYDKNCKFNIESIEEIPGAGLLAKANSCEIRIGNFQFINQNKIYDHYEQEGFCVYGCFNGILIAFNLVESLNEGAHNLVDYLKKNKIESFIFSGDKKSSVEKIASKVNIEQIFSLCKPEDKYNLLVDLQNKGGRALVLGDGVNDAAMLAKADVSIAMHGGVDIALHSSDIFMQNKNLTLIMKLIEYCKYVTKTINILLLVNVLYNVFAILLAFIGFVNPLFAAIFMPISSLSVFLIVFFRKGKLIWS